MLQLLYKRLVFQLMAATLQKSQPFLGLSNQKTIQFKLDRIINKCRSINKVMCILDKALLESVVASSNCLSHYTQLSAVLCRTVDIPA